MRPEQKAGLLEPAEKAKELKKKFKKSRSLPLQQKILLESGQLGFQPMMIQEPQQLAIVIDHRYLAEDHPRTYHEPQSTSQQYHGTKT
jgi:hypothetical protein